VDAHDGTGPHTWNYSVSLGQTTETDPFGNDTVHINTQLGGSCSIYETELDRYSGTGTNRTLLQKIQTNYQYDPSGGSLGFGNIVTNILPTQITTTDVLSGKTSQVTKTYDLGISLQGGWGGLARYGEVLIQTEADFGSGSPGNTLRKTNTHYMALSGPNAGWYLGGNLLNLPYTVQVTDGNNTQLSLTQYNYDETSLSSSGLTSAYQFDPNSLQYRGNNTSVYRWLNSGAFTCPNGNSGGSNGYLISKKTYLDDGMVNTSADSCGNTTTYAYDLTYWGALPTTVTNALSQSTTNTYDFNTSLLASTTDPNKLPTSYSYDSMWRISEVDRPDGGKDVITHQETTTPFTATLSTDINSTLKKMETNVFDGLGRESQNQLTSDPQGTVFTDTTYDALGRVATVSNPYRTGTDATTTTGTTTYGYDALSRKTSVTYPDSSFLKTAYCGPSTLVTDPTLKWRRSRVDALAGC